MLHNAYDTTVCQDYRIDPVIERLSEGYLREELQPLEYFGVKNYAIWMITDSNKDIPPFSHPITIKNKSLGDEELTFVDVRPYTKYNRNSDKSEISDRLNFQSLSLNGFLQSIWTKERYQDLLTAGSFPLALYGRWIATNIAQKLGLDPDNQMRITIHVMFFYLNQFRFNDIEYSEKELARTCTQIARASNIAFNQVFEIVNPIYKGYHIENLIEAIKNSIDNPRIDTLNVPLLISIVTYGWRGANAKEMMAVGIEYPPAWLALSWLTLNERGFKNTPLSKLAESMSKRHGGEDFARNLMRVIKIESSH
ncbi:hypothetical protein [Endozoicomonas sp. ONNA1]|uniref:hypothetical protein n=1 Tax=Endozoicomonas sp. ONNA1 TaxID=2828740 RepID=UPI0021483194|nr:hypothetical protein [Endozoicomonas sp. ONNA1]